MRFPIIRKSSGKSGNGPFELVSRLAGQAGLWAGAIVAGLALVAIAPFALWGILLAAAYYIRRIPQRKLFMARIFPVQPAAFYEWLADFAEAWAKYALLLSFIVLVLVGVVYFALDKHLLPLPLLNPWYGASIQVQSTDGNYRAEHTTNGRDEPYCFSNLTPGEYIVTRTNPAGLVSTTPDVVNTKVANGGWTSVVFGAMLSSAPRAIRPGDYASFAALARNSNQDLGSLCVLAWADVNANGLREPGEGPVPLAVIPQWLVAAGPLALFLLLLLANLAAFYETGQERWEAALWQAEPTAKLVIGSEEAYNNLSEKEKKQLIRHVAEAEIGVNKGTYVVEGGRLTTVNTPAGSFQRIGGPGVLIVQEGHVVVKQRQGNVSGIAKAGLNWLKPFERIAMVIYLGVQSQNVRVKQAITKDELFVEWLDVVIIHRVFKGKAVERSGRYKYDPEIIYDRIWSPRSVSNVAGTPLPVTATADAGKEAQPKADGAPVDWGESAKTAVTAIGERAVRDVVARHTLQELLVLAGPQRAEFNKQIRLAMNPITKQLLGEEVIAVDINQISVDKEACQKIWSLWQTKMDEQISRHKAKITRNEIAGRGAGQADAMATIEKVKTQLRHAIIKELSAMLADGLKNPKTVEALGTRLLETVEELTKTVADDDIGKIRYADALKELATSEGDKTILIGVEPWMPLSDRNKPNGS